MRQRFVDVASRLLDTNDQLAVVTADLTASLLNGARARHPMRVINVGIREQLLIGVTGGLALAGMRPIAHSFAPFLVERPFEQIKLDLNHQGVGAVLVSAGASYDMANAGRSHQAPGDVALLSTLPDWTITSLVHEPLHGVLVGMAETGWQAKAGQWNAYRDALMVDADAGFPEP